MSQGRFIARNLPFGVYRLNIERPGFGSFSTLVEIRSEVPLDYTVTLRVAPIETAIVVKDSATLLDPHRTAPVYYIGDETLRDRLGATPGRAVLDLVEMQPGWILEANGVLHPRGAEYNTQYVVDGFPVVDNRSPAFAPGLDVDEVQSMNVRTAGYPAEYGRKLGGVIEVTTKEDTRAGWHGSAVFDGGSFSTAGGDRLGAIRAGPHGSGSEPGLRAHRPLSRSTGSRELHKQRDGRRWKRALRHRFQRKGPACASP